MVNPFGDMSEREEHRQLPLQARLYPAGRTSTRERRTLYEACGEDPTTFTAEATMNRFV